MLLVDFWIRSLTRFGVFGGLYEQVLVKDIGSILQGRNTALELGAEGYVYMVYASQAWWLGKRVKSCSENEGRNEEVLMTFIFRFFKSSTAAI